MRLLLDTHIAIWAALSPNVLLPAERRALERASGPIVLSAVSVWELRLKWDSLRVSGGRKGPLDPSAIVQFANAMGWELLPLFPRHAAAALQQPLDHRDPFDEMLLVQAQEEGLLLLTRDGKLRTHPLAAEIG